MAFSRPLTVAITAAVLLVLVLGVDATMDRSLHLDQRAPSGSWRTLASQGEVSEREKFATPLGGPGEAFDRNSTVTFRLRVENGYPLAFDRSYVVLVNGIEAARGQLTAPARGTGTAEFDVTVERLAGTTIKPTPDALTQQYYPYVDVTVGDATFSASFNLEVRE